MRDFITSLIVIICSLALTGYIIMVLWNILIPSIFSLPAVTFWQALGLNLLFIFLTGNINAKNTNNQ